MPGLIERYMDRLPFEPGDPIVSLQEGSTPLDARPRDFQSGSAPTSALKIEGANPTSSFKDRGMTCAVSAAVRDGAEARSSARRPATPPRRWPHMLRAPGSAAS